MYQSNRNISSLQTQSWGLFLCSWFSWNLDTSWNPEDIGDLGLSIVFAMKIIHCLNKLANIYLNPTIIQGLKLSILDILNFKKLSELLIS